MRESGSLSSPQQTEPKSLLEVTGEAYGLRVADLSVSNSTSKGRYLGLESTSSSCSDSDLHSIFNLSQAAVRIEREVLSNQFAGTSNGQCCLKHLRKSLSDKISKFGVPDIQSQRPTVITPTHPGSPKPQRASTPLAQTLPNSLNSPTCSEVSSIGGEVFQDEVRPDFIPSSVRISYSNQSSIMEQAEDLVEDTRV